MIKQKNNDEEFEIVTLGEDYGADKFVKKYCIKFEIKYGEFIPRHKKWNNNCIEKPYFFNKEYSARNFFINYSNFVKYCDTFVYFSDKSNDNNKLLEIINKSEKNIVIVE